MLIKNLRLNFVKREKDHVVFQTENATQVTLPEQLLEQYADTAQPIYLNADLQPQAASQPQEILNELLNHQP